MILRHHEDRGSAAVELALLLPVLLLAALIALPVILRAQDANRLDESVGAALRYATKAAPNASSGPGDPTCAGNSRRRSGNEVATFLAASSAGIVTSSDVTVVVRSPSSGREGPDPCLGVPGSVVSVTVDWTTEVGAVGELVNGLAALIGADPVIAESVRQLTAQGVLE